jgi:subtilisin family serine protease
MTAARLRVCGAIAAALIAGCVPNGRDTEVPAQARSPEALKLTPPLVPAASGAMSPRARLQPQPVPGELLVKFRKGTLSSQITNSLNKMSLISTRAYASVPRLRKVTLAPGVSTAAALQAYAADPDVEYAEPNYRYRPLAVPNDPRFGEQWSLNNTGQILGARPGVDISAEAAWDITTGGTDVVVAVIDGGVDYTHEDLAANIWRNTPECSANGIDDDANGYVDDCLGIDTADNDSDPMDGDGHGTHVAGIIGAAGNNGIGISGVAWNSKLLPCRFIDATGEGDAAAAVACLDYVAALKDRGVNIVATNNSWGGGHGSRALRDAIDAQLARGILFITAAGNDRQRSDDSHYYPSGESLPCAYPHSNIVCVGASSYASDYGFFSNLSSNVVHISAPGVQILSTLPGNQYGVADGTSMSAGFVSGIAALLKSADPARDWRAIRSLILTTGRSADADLPPRGLNHETVTSTMVNAAQALSCAAPAINRRLTPRTTGSIYYDASLNTPQPLELLSIACGAPAGATHTVVVNPGAVSVTLRDDGTGFDRLAGDGVFAGSWTPTAMGEYTLDFPGQRATHNGIFDDLVTARVIGNKPGFPKRMFRFTINGATQPIRGYPTLVANLDDAPDLEIIASGSAVGPTYAWKADGTDVPGWPRLVTGTTNESFGAAMLAAGNLAGAADRQEIFAGYGGLPGALEAYARDGAMLPGWPRDSANYMVVPPVLADIDHDGVDEIFTSESDYTIRGYRGDGAPLPGFPAYFISGNQGQTPVAPIAVDLDNDGVAELVSTSDSSAGGVIAAWRSSGTLLPGFPLQTLEELDVVGGGDVDADGVPELVFLTHDAAWTAFVVIYGADGSLERTWSIPNTDLGSRQSGVLADMNQDGIPEIIVASRDPNHPPHRIAVYDAQGSVLPGWPASIEVGTNSFLSAASMAVGDLDGDGLPDVFIVAGNSMYLIRNNGTVAPGFPISNGEQLTDRIFPAIADIDGDGRNEVIMRSDEFAGDYGYYRHLFVYDFGGPAAHGPVEWAMSHGDARRTSNYKLGKNLVAQAFLSVQAGGPGRVVSAPAGISCGTTCTHRYSKGAVVTLTATPNDGETFYGWRGACSGTNAACTVTVSDLTTVAAEFRSQTLTEVVIGNGTITSSPAGFTCTGSCMHSAAMGSTLTLMAIAAADSEFTGWSGACAGTATCRVTLDVARSVTATFALKPEITVTRAGTGQGVLTSTPAGIDCGASCAARFGIGSTLSLSAAPAANSEFESWLGACSGASSTGTTCTLVADVSKSASATFRLKPELTITRGGTGAGSVTSSPAGIDCGADCSEFFPSNGQVTLTVVAASGSAFGGWTGACTGTQLSCTLTMDAAKSAGITFNQNASSSSGGGGSSGGGKSGGGGSFDLLALLFMLIVWIRINGCGIRAPGGSCRGSLSIRPAARATPSQYPVLAL